MADLISPEILPYLITGVVTLVTGFMGNVFLTRVRTAQNYKTRAEGGATVMDKQNDFVDSLLKRITELEKHTHVQDQKIRELYEENTQLRFRIVTLEHILERKGYKTPPRQARHEGQ